MVTDEGSVPEIAQYGQYCIPLDVFIASRGSNFYILFAFTAAGGVVPCGGRKMSPRTSSIEQIILFFRSFDIGQNIQSIKSLRLESSSKQCSNYLTPFRHVSLI